MGSVDDHFGIEDVVKGNTYSYSRKDVEEFLSANHFKLYDDDRPIRHLVPEEDN